MQIIKNETAWKMIFFNTAKWHTMQLLTDNVY